MADVKHFDTQAGSPPYKNLFHTVSLVPPNTSLAFISTQWAADPATGKLVEGTEGDVHKQSKVIWANIVGILKELGAEMKDVVQRTVNFM
jgi:enamine deaminase RidA (YjgF/YER057c/UK114 family)